MVSSLARGGSGDFARAVAGAYEAGVEVSFAGLFTGENRRRVSVPTYPFQRERYWVEAPRRRPAGGHALLGLRRDARDGEVSFETELSGSAPGWLSDHRVFGEVLAPGALYASQVLEALRERDSGSPWSLEEVEIHRPLVFPDGAFRTVQVVLGAEGGFEVVSREESGSVWDLHAEGRVSSGFFGNPVGLDIAELRGGLLEVDPAAIYRGLAKAGIAFGPSFRSLSGLWSGAEEALGEVALPAELSGGGLLAHPVLLDACFQVMSGLSALPEEGVRLPVGWERLWLAGPLPERMFCRARLREGSGEIWKADLEIYGPAGEALGGVEGFRLRRASRASLLGVRVDELLYEVEWRAGPPVGLRSAAFLRSPGEVSSGLRPAAEFLAAEGVDETRNGARAGSAGAFVARVCAAGAFGAGLGAGAWGAFRGGCAAPSFEGDGGPPEVVRSVAVAAVGWRSVGSGPVGWLAGDGGFGGGAAGVVGGSGGWCRFLRRGGLAAAVRRVAVGGSAWPSGPAGVAVRGGTGSGGPVLEVTGRAGGEPFGRGGGGSCGERSAGGSASFGAGGGSRDGGDDGVGASGASGRADGLQVHGHFGGVLW